MEGECKKGAHENSIKLQKGGFVESDLSAILEGKSQQDRETIEQ